MHDINMRIHPRDLQRCPVSASGRDRVPSRPGSGRRRSSSGRRSRSSRWDPNPSSRRSSNSRDRERRGSLPTGGGGRFALRRSDGRRAARAGRPVAAGVAAAAGERAAPRRQAEAGPGSKPARASWQGPPAILGCDRRPRAIKRFGREPKVRLLCPGAWRAGSKT